jgi:hypothetical protein
MGRRYGETTDQKTFRERSLPGIRVSHFQISFAYLLTLPPEQPPMLR